MVSDNSDYLILMIVGLIGTTITPWMQFYLQASIVEKGITQAPIRAFALGRDSRLHRDRRDRVFYRGGVRGDVCTYSGNHNITDAAEAAKALKPFAGTVRWHCCLPWDW